MKLWGGRFTKETDAAVNAFNASLPFDRRLYEQDIRGSIAHVTMLAAQDILTHDEKLQIITGLNSILEDLASGTLVFDETSEDIHSFVEANLIARMVMPARSCTPAAAVTIRLLWTCACTPGIRSKRRMLS